MAAENLLGNVPNKVAGDYQRPLPRDFETASNGDVSWKDETGTYNWDAMGVLPKAISVADFSSAPPTENDGDIYFGTTDTTAVHADWDSANKYDWVRFTADTSSWSNITPSEGVLCYDSSAGVWYSSDTSANGWNELSTKVSSGNNYTTKTIEIGDWNMSSTASITVAHGLSATEWKTIRSVDCVIRNDSDSVYLQIDSSMPAASNNNNGGIDFIDSSDFNLSRYATGGFDDALNYASTSYNRGWITFDYIKN